MQENTQKRENTQTTILALLLAYKGGCTLRQLDKDYYELEGEHIPWKGLGYASLLSLLHGMSKSVKIEDKNNTIIVKGIASEKSKHVSKLVAEQKSQKYPTGRKIYKPSHYFPKTAPLKIRISAEILKRIVSWINDHPDGIHKDYVFQEVQSCMPFANITMRDMEEQLKELSHKICQKDNKVYPVQNKVLNFDYSINSNDISHSEFVSHEKQKWKSSIVTAAGDEDSDDMLDYNEEDIFEVVPSNYRSQSLRVQSTVPTSTSIKEPISECQNQWLEHTLVVQSKQNDPDNPCGSSSNDNSEIAKEFNNNIRESERNCLNYKNAEILVNDRVKVRLESLIKNHPGGIWCADLPEKYLEEYKVPLNYAELGFNSVREFAAELPQIFHCVQPHDTGDFKLYYAKSIIPINKSEEKPKDLTKLYQIFEINDKEALPATVSLNTCKELIPDEVMTIGDCVGILSVADLLKIEAPYVEVLVVEVFTPAFFWVQLRNKQNMFKKFMDNLHNFYLTKSHQYVIPPVVLERGLNCACVYNGIWHRGIIKAVKPDFQVTVMFYDYGTLKTYSPDKVFYLHKTFSRLPAQAIPCGLVNVRPCRGSKWSCSATHNFAVRTSQIPFVATIASINVEENSMMVTLTDTLEEEDVHINDWLVEQKLAEHGKMDDKVDMSNILVYVEENLLFTPEQCYEKEEVDMFNRDNEKSSENVVNVPLVSPQSTLNAPMFKPTSEYILLDTQKSCEEEATTPRRTTQNKTESNTFTFHNSNINTNPFLQDHYAYRQVENDINPQKFMQLWHENLQLQIHITDILRILLNKVVKDSANDGNSNLKDDRRILDLIRSILSFFNKQMPISVDNLNANTVNMNEDNVPTTANTYYRRNTTTNNDFLNTEYAVECSTFSAMNQQPLNTTSYNKSNDFNTSVDRFIQNTDMQNAFRNTSIKTTPLMPKNNNIDKVEQYLGSQETIRKPNLPPGFERLYSTSNSDQQCYLTNNVNKDFLISTNNSVDNNITVKETNPFKLSLAGKLHIPDAQEENCLHSDNVSTLRRNHEPIVEYDLISFENDNSKIKYMKHGTLNDCNDSSVDHYQYALTDPVNNTNSVQRNLFLSCETSLNYNCSVNDVCDAVSKVIINEQPLQHNIHENELKTDKHEPISATGIYNFNASCIQSNDFVVPQEMFKSKPINDNFIFTSNDDLNNCRSSIMLPTNSLESLSLTNTNVDEGYLSRPSTSHTIYTSSPIIQLTNEAPNSQKVMANNMGSINSKSVCNDMWNNSFLNTAQLKDANKVPSVSKTNAEQVAYDRNWQQNHERNCVMANTLHSHLKIDNLGMSNTQETDLKSVLGNARIPQYLSSNYKVLFQTVELPMHTVHVFHYQREGWLLVDEFVNTFTQYRAALSMISLLHMFNVHVQFEAIDRDKISVEVVKCNGILPKATQDIMNGTGTLHLMQLKSALEVLHKLEIISDKDIRDLFVHENYVCGSIVHKIWLIFKTYAQLKHHIECEQ